MIVIDFRKENILLNEAGLLSALGSWTKTILKHIYGKDTKMVGNLSITDVAKFLKEED